jgi:tryptophan synthase alpha subunit
MTTKQTVIEWLQESMLLCHEQQMQFEGLFQQAKQMEKEQIKDAFDMGYSNYFFDKGGEQYYNETYNVKDN